MTVRVYLVDDHAVVLEAFKMLLESDPDISVVGMAFDGRTAVAELRKLQADLVIMDITMPELNGIEAIKQIREFNKEIRILVLSMHSTSEHVFRAFQAGAAGFLLKEETRDLVQAVHAIMSGERLVSSKLADLDLLQCQSGYQRSPLDVLSNREREVLQLTVEGKSAEEIAEILVLSAKSVETYRTRLKKKLGVNDLPALVMFAIQHGITPLR
jgi:DNA-binding NarL/FixJ family response regulator